MRPEDQKAIENSAIIKWIGYVIGGLALGMVFLFIYLIFGWVWLIPVLIFAYLSYLLTRN